MIIKHCAGEMGEVLKPNKEDESLFEKKTKEALKEKTQEELVKEAADNQKPFWIKGE